MSAPLPSNEAERLQTLCDYQILDTPPEAAFERITSLAARLFGVPIVLVSLVDANRQWFKSCFGLDTRQTDRKLSFCAHAILSDAVMVVPDATADPRFVNNGLVTGPPHIRFYAGAPLKTPEGLNLGSFCLMDTSPRQFSDEHQAMLADLAATVVDELELRRVARELREKEETLRQIASKNSQLAAAVTNLQTSVVITDPNLPDNPIIFINPAFTAMTGYPAEEVVGRNCRFLQGPESDPATVREMREAIAERRPFTGVVCNYRKDGSSFLNELTINPVFDEEGQVVNLVGLQNDVTERKAAEEAHARLAAIVNYSEDAIVGKSLDGIITSWNAGAQQLYGYSAEEIIGQPASLLITPDRPDEERQLLERIRNGERVEHYETVRLHKDGRRLEVSLVMSPIKDGTGRITGASVIARDIMDRKQAEAALQEAKKEAERANLAKSEFLSRMSHELRTPLNAIIGFGQLLEEDDLPPDQHQSIAHIVKGGKHLLSLINEVLDIASIEAGRMQLSLEPVGVRDIVHESLDLVRPLTSPRQIQIVESSACSETETRSVRADNQRLRQVLLNLLANAIKYNRDGGSVCVECESAADNRLRIVVRDTGPGIAPDKIERLFVPFDRLGAEQTRIEGTGLGLALSQRLIEAMDGQMGVQSTLGEGSAFWIELPLTESQLTRPELTCAIEAPLPESDHQERTLLYIEDNLANLELVQTILQRRPEIKLLSAMQGSVGLDLARENRPALILLDLHLPDIPGHEVLLRLRAEPTTRDIPIVVLSADATPGQIARLLSSGANGYLTKPLDMHKFLEVINKTLQKSENP